MTGRSRFVPPRGNIHQSAARSQTLKRENSNVKTGKQTLNGKTLTLDRREYSKVKTKTTRLHSSRMRTARVLTISPSMLCTMGVYLVPGGCTWSVGVEVSALGGVCSGGQGVGCLLPGGSAPAGGCLLLGGVPGQVFPLWTDIRL